MGKIVIRCEKLEKAIFEHECLLKIGQIQKDDKICLQCLNKRNEPQKPVIEKPFGSLRKAKWFDQKRNKRKDTDTKLFDNYYSLILPEEDSPIWGSRIFPRKPNVNKIKQSIDLMENLHPSFWENHKFLR
jgi:hypothetical protein